MKTVLFATCYIGTDRHVERYKKYIAYYLPKLHLLGADRIFLIDDGSDPEQLKKLNCTIINIDDVKDSIFPQPEDKVIIIHFSNHYGRPERFKIPGWWRSFSFMAIAAYFFTIDKLIHIESDTYVLSKRMFKWLKTTNNRWALPKSPHYKFPDTCIQVIPNFTTATINYPDKPKSNFAELFARFYAGESFWFNKGDFPHEQYIPEHSLPFDEVTSQFVGDRWGEPYFDEIPEIADYISNAFDIDEVFEGKNEAIQRLIDGAPNEFPENIEIARNKTAFHSGDMGDVIYAIPLLRQLNIKTLYLNPDTWFNTKMGLFEIDFLRSLLESEGFEVKVPERKEKLKIDYDFDAQRYKNVDMKFLHLAKSVAEPFREKIDISQKWLTSNEPVKTVDVIINQTTRYKGEQFDWRKIFDFLETNGLSYAYVGTGFEYSRFLRNNQFFYGKLSYIKTDSAEELKNVIAGCKVFIGNQSLPFAIAEGLKVARIQETCLWVPNCLPEDPTGYSVQTAEDMDNAINIIKEYLEKDAECKAEAC